jgi:hypothetical protein
MKRILTFIDNNKKKRSKKKKHCHYLCGLANFNPTAISSCIVQKRKKKINHKRKLTRNPIWIGLHPVSLSAALSFSVLIKKN